MAKTTPDRRLELVRLAPTLQQSFRRAVRLHPRRVSAPQNPAISKVGGQFLWPAAEAWPVCSEPDYRDQAVHNEPLVPLLQLLKKDFPQFPFPPPCDVFQLLWCPWGHENDDQPSGWMVLWRELEGCEPLLEDLPRASFNNVQECALSPETIDDLPCWTELAGEGESEYDCARRLLGDGAPEEYVDMNGGAAPGLKLFGWPVWIQCPAPPNCGCGRRMEPLLSVTSGEFDDPNAEFWCPLEDQQEHKRSMAAYWDIRDPSRYDEFAKHSHPFRFDVGDCGSMHLFYCPECPGPKIEAVLQYS
jgi:hypothetical protein